MNDLSLCIMLQKLLSFFQKRAIGKGCKGAHSQLMLITEKDNPKMKNRHLEGREDFRTKLNLFLFEFVIKNRTSFIAGRTLQVSTTPAQIQKTIP